MAISAPTIVAAFLSTGLISLAPNVILFLFPNYVANEKGSRILSLGQAIAAGGLLGDVFLHTLPHASSHTSENASGLWVLSGFTVFFAMDLLIRSLEGHHHHGESAQQNDQIDAPTSQHAHSSSSLVILNMAADALHNFTDGLAIGASYIASSKMHQDSSLLALITSRGGLVSISILLHEIPHELGDYCTLLRAGYSRAQAIRAQFMTAIAAFIGTGLALCAGSTDQSLLLLVTAGGFIYLAASTMLPEVLLVNEDSHSNGKVDGIIFRMAQLLAFVLGVFLLYLVARIEGDHGEHGHAHHHHGVHSMHGHHHDHDAHHIHSEL